MRSFQISRYIKKYSAAIVTVSLLAGMLLYYVASHMMQSYVAQAVIKYPEGETVDTSEIYASNIVSEAMDNLGLDKESVNTDYIRNRIKVTPIVSEDETLLKEAVIKLGEEYTGKPSAYIVTYTANVSEGREFARAMLNEILDVYLTWYGETYENTSGGANTISDICGKNYDYIEMMEIIDDFVDTSITAMGDKNAIDPSFRSYTSGYSFLDLYNEFYYIRENEASGISADILSNKITRNRDVLLSKYEKRNSDMVTENAASQEEIDNIKLIIDTYVSMMSESGNTNITSEYILDDIYESYQTDANGNVQQGDITVQYDRLLDGYVADRDSYENNLLDIAYNEYILATFADAPRVSSSIAQSEINGRITALVDKLNNLYSIYDVTNDEFNEYLGAMNVTMLSSIGVSETVPVKLLTLAAVFVFGVLGCGGAILLGRLGDIMEYYAFTDKTDGLPNRTSCDRYLAEMDSKLLFGDFSVVVFKLTDLVRVNREHGRDAGDKMIKVFARTITGVFIPSDDVFVGNNGSGQYLVFARGWSREKTENGLAQIASAISVINDQEEHEIEYSVGMDEAMSSKCYNIRKLLSLAMKDMVASMPAPVAASGADGAAGEGASDPTSGAADMTGRNGEIAGTYGRAEEGAGSSDYASESTVTGAAGDTADTAADTADDADVQKKAVGYDSSDKIFTLGSDYYAKFRSMRKKS